MRHANRDRVYEAIDGERDYQNALGASRTDDRQKQVGDYLTLLKVYVRKAEEAYVFNPGDEQALDAIRKVAGIAVKAMEELGVVKRVIVP